MVLSNLFKERLNLINESPSQLTFECPVCRGHSLKINKTSNAYSCFSSGCSPNEIRKLLGIKSGGFYKEVIQKVSTPVYISKSNLDFHLSNLTQPKHKIFWYEKYQQEAVKTTYFYDDTHKVDRIRLLKDNKKNFYPQYFEDGKWNLGSKGFANFLNQNLIKEENKTICFAEGEKCAMELSRFFLCLTAPGFGSNSYNFLSSNLKNIQFKVRNILIFADPDRIGQVKAQLLQRICWEYYIPCSIITFSDNQDIYDFIKDHKVTNSDILKQYILELL